MFRPVFVGPAGSLEEDPLAAAGPAPKVDLAGLARLFTTPALFGEFAPSSFWRDVEVVWSPPIPATGDPDFLTVFGDSVAELCVDAEVVGVALSGGIDSLAVLWHVVRLVPRRKVVALVVDLVDDGGDRASVVVAQLLRDLGLADRVDVLVVDPSSCSATPAWSPYGPRMDALPQINATVAERAAAAGAQILLSGNGADELLSIPRYAVADVLTLHGPRAARQYVSDMASSGFGRWGEFAGWGSTVLGLDRKLRAYAATSWPEWCRPEASSALRARWHEDSVRWARTWVQSKLLEHQRADRSWAEADAWYSWWPRAFLPPATTLPEVSPFCEGGVIGAVWSKALGWRYSPAGRSPYLRVKGQISQLFPEDVRPCLPAKKRYYAAALGGSVAGNVEVDCAAGVGLLDAGALATSTCTATRMMAVAVEAWLDGAVAAGIAI